MERRYKLIIGAVGGAALIGAGVIFIPPLLKTNNAAPDLDAIPSAMLHKVGLDGITIRLDVKVKNPTEANFKMKYPYFRLKYKGDSIGTSQSINQDVAMKQMGEANFNNILLNIPLFSSLTSAVSLVKAAMAKEEINLEVEVMTHIDPYWKYDPDKDEWSRRPNLGKNTSLIEVKKAIPITLNKKQA